ncbi:MAG: hypothetical protein EZS28_006876 [Streblomastix strix]|uniref:Uncharacterized protein n=1 Tax=Streblomastix strix TaxID=222440 RepID=A0A5J4WTZ4_9EUKA|nr:MAG: hypothetical protein EZS28_006876 [Streblomastix strix]
MMDRGIQELLQALEEQELARWYKLVNLTGASPANDLATQELARERVYFNGLDDPQADWLRKMQIGADANQKPLNANEHIKQWIVYSIACRQFQQIALCKNSIKLWETSIYSREWAVIAANSLFDQCINNSASVSSLESIVRSRRQCRIILDIPDKAFGNTADAINYLIPDDITLARISFKI